MPIKKLNIDLKMPGAQTDASIFYSDREKENIYHSSWASIFEALVNNGYDPDKDPHRRLQWYIDAHLSGARRNKSKKKDIKKSAASVNMGV